MELSTMLDDYVEEIRRACDGLSYPSSIESPVDVLTFATADVYNAFANANLFAPGVARTALSMEEFFGPLADPPSGARGRSQDARWLNLWRLLELRLSMPRVYRVGRVDVDIYIIGVVGLTPIVLRTRALEP
jgi:hypothetical protein